MTKRYFQNPAKTFQSWVRYQYNEIYTIVYIARTCRYTIQEMGVNGGKAYSLFGIFTQMFTRIHVLPVVSVGLSGPVPGA